MSYARVETSVRTHRKFIKAGPAPSWLWLCGLLYCQDALTDGFIADETLDYLGVKNARRLVLHLETANLWDRVDGGWQIHDYLKHNKPATEINRIKAERRQGGNLGGRPKVNLQGEPSRLTIPETFPVDVDDVAVVAASGMREEGPGETRFDTLFWQLHRAYPEKRRSSGPVTEQLFIQQFQADTRKPAVVFAEMLANLATQIAGHEWRVKGMVPKLEKWLRDGLWRQRHEVTPASEVLSDKTARTLASAAAFIKAGERGAH
jgi:hypothetical protein